MIEFDDCSEEFWMFVVLHDWRALVWFDFDAVELTLARFNEGCQPSVWGLCAAAAATRPHVSI
jgi:hypothetical protein